MNRKKTFDELSEYIFDSIQTLNEKPYLYRYVVDGIRNNIFYWTQKMEFFSGHYSYNAYTHFLIHGKVGLTKEHFYSVKRLSIELINSANSIEDIRDVIKQKGMYNLTTNEENIELRIRNQSYIDCGIRLNTLDGWERGEKGWLPNYTSNNDDGVPLVYKHYTDEWVDDKSIQYEIPYDYSTLINNSVMNNPFW